MEQGTAVVPDAGLLGAMVEAAPCAMALVSAEGLIVLANAEAEKLFGYPRVELERTSIDYLVPESARARHQAHRAAFFADPETRLMGGGRDLYGLTREGREVPVEIGLRPVQTPQGTFVIASVVDITRRKLAEAALIERTEQLAASNRDLEQFAYLASHDLQEPLRAVAGCVRLLSDRYHDQIDERANRYIEHAVAGVRRMQQMIDDLLGFSRVGREQEKYRRFDSGQALKTALLNLHSAIEDSGARIESESLPELFGDEGQFAQLLQNLVGNSLKFRRPDTLPLIAVRARRQDAHWIFSVSDNGIGIDAEQADKVFGIFRRLHSRRQYSGSGIGLAICKRIVEAHGGRIWIEPSTVPGTTVAFAIPDPARLDEGDRRSPGAL